MLSLALIEEISFQLEADRLSQREIARRLGVSRATVAALAHGRRGIHGRSAEPEPLPEDIERPDPPARCPHCGYLVHLPCLICQTREYRHAQRILSKLGSRRRDVSQRTRQRPSRRSARRCRAA